MLPSLLSAGCRYKDEEKGWKEEADHDTLAVRALDMETKAPAAPGIPDVGFRVARRPDACRGAWTNEGKSNRRPDVCLDSFGHFSDGLFAG
jgi:hypothetical protein